MLAMDSLAAKIVFTRLKEVKISGIHWMVERKVGIVLCGIVLADNRIGRQIQGKPTVFSEEFADHCIKAIFLDDLPNDQP